ncbi:MAG: tRNA uracil 4-sulfurtransferase ThiI [Clostridiaceae bacterium]
MKKLILIKYAPEIFLKGQNRNKFERLLKERIKKSISDLEYEIIDDSGRWFIASKELETVVERVKKVFGVKEICPVYQVESTMEAINAEALRQSSEFKGKTYKVETNRANKSFPMNSMEVSRAVGAHLFNNAEDITVDVHKPDIKLYVEIRKEAYVYSERIKAVGGMPYGVNGSTALMLSGGIDSPVAGYMMAKRGTEVCSVYFHSHPYTSERAKEKVVKLASILKGYTGRMKLYVVPFTEIQMQIMDKCREDELTIIMRRFMMRVACAVADKEKIHSVTTGESVGQVASQTMEGLVVSNAVADRPVFRPLIAMDKVDIMDVSKAIGTYETSILPYEDCCTIFVPKHPKTRPILEQIEKSESALEIDKLVEWAVENSEIIMV